MNQLTALLEIKGHEVFSTEPEASVRDAVERMNAEGIGALLVLDGDEVVGIFTERDVLRRVVAAGRDPGATKVAEVMTRDLVVVRPAMRVEEAMSVITEKRCRHLPVMEQGRLLGMVSAGDLTRWVTRNQAFHIQDLVNYITGKYPV